jgi:hypothetical protein
VRRHETEGKDIERFQGQHRNEIAESEQKVNIVGAKFGLLKQKLNYKQITQEIK